MEPLVLSAPKASCLATLMDALMGFDALKAKANAPKYALCLPSPLHSRPGPYKARAHLDMPPSVRGPHPLCEGPRTSARTPRGIPTAPGPGSEDASNRPDPETEERGRQGVQAYPDGGSYLDWEFGACYVQQPEQISMYPPPPCANTGLSKHGDPVFPHFWSFF